VLHPPPKAFAEEAAEECSAQAFLWLLLFLLQKAAWDWEISESSWQGPSAHPPEFAPGPATAELAPADTDPAIFPESSRKHMTAHFLAPSPLPFEKKISLFIKLREPLNNSRFYLVGFEKQAKGAFKAHED